jgi:hypothetical protein
LRVGGDTIAVTGPEAAKKSTDSRAKHRKPTMSPRMLMILFLRDTARAAAGIQGRERLALKPHPTESLLVSPRVGTTAKSLRMCSLKFSAVRRDPWQKHPPRRVSTGRRDEQSPPSIQPASGPLAACAPHVLGEGAVVRPAPIPREEFQRHGPV